MKSRITYEKAAGNLALMDSKSRYEYRKTQKRILEEILGEAEEATKRDIEEVDRLQALIDEQGGE